MALALIVSLSENGCDRLENKCGHYWRVLICLLALIFHFVHARLSRKDLVSRVRSASSSTWRCVVALMSRVAPVSAILHATDSEQVKEWIVLGRLECKIYANSEKTANSGSRSTLLVLLVKCTLRVVSQGRLQSSCQIA